MRVIKFRAWDNRGNEIILPPYGICFNRTIVELKYIYENPELLK